MNVFVIGASRGIGLEFVRQYREQWDRVVATARDDAGLQRLAALGAQPLKLDVADPASVSGLARQLDGEKIDVALYVAGVYSTAGATQPTREEFDRLMHTNVLGAMQAIPQVAPMVEAAQGRFAFITSEMGHIAGANSSFGWTYRVSKAALNMAVAAARHGYPKATVVALSPGWVRTDMGARCAAVGGGQRCRHAAHDRRPHAPPERCLPQPRRPTLQGLVKMDPQTHIRSRPPKGAQASLGAARREA